MTKYVKKPIEIDAIIFSGENQKEVIEFCKPHKCCINYDATELELIVETLEGPLIASINDYIIRGIKGEVYPCKPDIFRLTYERA